jgi:hypothetical protein
MLSEEQTTEARATLEELNVEHRDLDLVIDHLLLSRLPTSCWCAASKSASCCSRIASTSSKALSNRMFRPEREKSSKFEA